ncbi:MAG TPA: HEAT repeat domain-containing protein [Bacteroidia bacterium]|nr:HEAT repeat domain-containing protein [Bacteroidia bacterium]HNS11396.1 HEAT repeat domain-containing protein [Bacteroidia bacterium]
MNRILQIDWSNIQYTVDEFSRTLYTFPVHIRFLLGVTVMFLVFIFILLNVILGSRIYKTKLLTKRKKIREKYKPLFTRLLFNDESLLLDPDLHLQFDKEDLTKKFHRSIISDEIIHLHENFTGETASRLELLFVKLGLHKDSLEKTINKRWYLAAKGMRELALMNVKESQADLYSFLNHKNDILRMEARIAIMKLSAEEPLSFLSKIKEPLSAWDQANIHAMLAKMPEQMIPDFSTWLNSSNKSVVQFCILMIGSFRQQESVGVLIHLLDHEDEVVRLSSIKALGELNAYASEEKLVNMYPLETEDVQIEIVKTLEAVGKENSAHLMEKILKQPIKNHSISIQAVKTFLATAKEGKQKLEHMLESSNPQLRLIVQHAQDERL